MIILREEIKKYMSGKRYAHTLSVEAECIELAAIFKLSKTETEKLRTAALLHDITKGKTFDENVKICEKYHIDYGENYKHSPKIFHSLTGAVLAENNYPEFVDNLVYSAILCHTTGKENMNILEKLLYLADYIEKSRNFTDCKVLRKHFYSTINTKELYRALNDTLVLSFDMTIRHLMYNNDYIDLHTIKSRNYLIISNKAGITDKK
jgi:predicted HD superfamily hydrolase involved in NAD metabolism